DTLGALDVALLRPRHDGFLGFQATAGDLVHGWLRDGGDPARGPAGRGAARGGTAPPSRRGGEDRRRHGLEGVRVLEFTRLTGHRARRLPGDGSGRGQGRGGDRRGGGGRGGWRA